MLSTFELGLQHGRRLRREQNLLGVFRQRTTLLGRHDELAQEARAVANVVVLVVLGQVEHILTQ